MYEQPLRWYQFVIPVVISVIIALVIIYFLTVKQDVDWWNKISGILSFVSILIAVGVFICEIFYERNKAKNEFKERISRALMTLKNDVNDIMEGFLTKKEYTRVKDKDKNLDFTQMQVGTEVYDSILSSGLFTYFQNQTQLVLGNFYFNIKLHNRWLNEKNRFEFENKLGYSSVIESVYDQVDIELGQRVTEYEDLIKDTLFPKLKHYLEGELKMVEDSKYIIPEYKPPEKVIPKQKPSEKV